MNLMDLFHLYSRKCLRDSSPRTLVLYEYSIRSFELTLGREGTVKDLTDDNLEDHLHRVVRSGLSPATANKDHNQICAIWRFANRNRLVETWPNVPMLRVPEKVPLGWLPHELEHLFKAIATTPGMIAGVPASLWWRGMINLILDTGERIGAIRQVTRFDLHGEHLLIPATYRKGKTRDKLYHLTEDTIIDLKDILSHHESDLLFPWDRSYTLIYKHFTRILDRAGLSTDSRSKFHRLRRTVASAVANQGGNPSLALDHSSPKVTAKYLDPRIVKQTPTSDYVSQWRGQNRIKDHL